MKLQAHSWEMIQANLRRLDSHLASSSFVSSASWMNCSAQEVQLFLLAQDWAAPGLSRGGSGGSTMDCLVIHPVVLAAWDDLVSDLEGPEGMGWSG